MLHGFSIPLSPQGKVTLAPAPPWHYAGDVLAIDFWADPAAVAAVLPPPVDPDSADPGHCVVFFCDWQYASATGQEPLDPIRSQYREMIILVDGVYDGNPVACCPYIYVETDLSMARGWVQGWPKRLGQIHLTRTFGLASPAAPLVASGGAFGATLSASGRRLADARVDLEAVSDQPLFLGQRPVLNVRHFAQLAAPEDRRPAVHELVRSVLSDVQRTDTWEGTAELDFGSAPDAELDALKPVRVGRGYRSSMAFTVNGVDVLRRLETATEATDGPTPASTPLSSPREADAASSLTEGASPTVDASRRVTA